MSGRKITPEMFGTTLTDDDDDHTTAQEPDKTTHVYGNPLDIDVQTHLHPKSDKPECCVSTPECRVRQVKLVDDGQVVDIHFKRWNDNFGYWILHDRENEEREHIVKFVNGQYYCWDTAKGIARKPVARAVRQGKGGGQNTQCSRNSQSRQLHNSSDGKWSVLSQASSSLRPRTIRQDHPYTVYNLQRTYDDRGVRLSDIELEDLINKTPPTSPMKSLKRKRRRIKASGNDANIQWPSPPYDIEVASPSMGVSKEDVLTHTTFRTQLDGFDRGAIVICARNCSSNEALFTAIKSKWAFKLVSKQVSYCVASFSWLPAGRNILLQDTDNDSYESVIAEVSCALKEKALMPVEVLIKIYVEQSN